MTVMALFAIAALPFDSVPMTPRDESDLATASCMMTKNTHNLLLETFRMCSDFVDPNGDRGPIAWYRGSRDDAPSPQATDDEEELTDRANRIFKRLCAASFGMALLFGLWILVDGALTLEER